MSCSNMIDAVDCQQSLSQYQLRLMVLKLEFMDLWGLEGKSRDFRVSVSSHMITPANNILGSAEVIVALLGRFRFRWSEYDEIRVSPSCHIFKTLHNLRTSFLVNSILWGALWHHFSQKLCRFKNSAVQLGQVVKLGTWVFGTACFRLRYSEIRFRKKTNKVNISGLQVEKDSYILVKEYMR